MVGQNHGLPITRQCQLLSLNRPSFYYRSKTDVSEDDLRLMRRIDAMHLQRPFTAVAVSGIGCVRMDGR